MGTKELTPEQKQNLFDILQERFEYDIKRHPWIERNKILDKLQTDSDKIWSLYQMEKTGWEPDVIIFDNNIEDIYFVDCSSESPSDRRSLCYDNEALHARKTHKPKNSAINLANEMNIQLLTEEQYKYLQSLGNFDLKTSSWIVTPDAIRSLGGALFADKRYNQTFVYHNGADSYYASRWFRWILKI